MNKKTRAIVVSVAMMLMISLPEKIIAIDYKFSNNIQTLNQDTRDISFPAVISDAFPNNDIAVAIAYGVYHDEMKINQLVTLEQLEAIEEIRFSNSVNAVELDQLLVYNKFPKLKQIHTTYNSVGVVLESLSVLNNDDFPVLEEVKINYIANSENAIVPDIQIANLKKFQLLLVEEAQQLKEIPDFSGIPKLENLIINSEATEIPNFSHMPNLIMLSITTIATDTFVLPGFDIMPNLEQLTIVGTEALNLSNNLELPEMNLPNLLSLRLSNLGLTSLSSLSNLPKLEVAEFDWNKINRLEAIVNQKLIILSLIGNKLTEVPAIAPDNNVLILDVRINEIVDFTNIGNYQNVTIVEAGDNKIGDISMLEEGFPNLNYIRFHFNSLESRPERFSGSEGVLFQRIDGEIEVPVGENYLLNLPIVAQIYNGELIKDPNNPLVMNVKLDGELIEIELGEIIEIPTSLLEPGVHQLTIVEGPGFATEIGDKYVEAEYKITVVSSTDETTVNNDSDENDTNTTLPTTGTYTSEFSFIGGVLLTVSVIIFLFRRIKEKLL